MLPQLCASFHPASQQHGPECPSFLWLVWTAGKFRKNQIFAFFVLITDIQLLHFYICTCYSLKCVTYIVTHSMDFCGFHCDHMSTGGNLCVQTPVLNSVFKKKTSGKLTQNNHSSVQTINDFEKMPCQCQKHQWCLTALRKSWVAALHTDEDVWHGNTVKVS